MDLKTKSDLNTLFSGYFFGFVTEDIFNNKIIEILNSVEQNKHFSRPVNGLQVQFTEEEKHNLKILYSSWEMNFVSDEMFVMKVSDFYVEDTQIVSNGTSIDDPLCQALDQQPLQVYNVDYENLASGRVLKLIFQICELSKNFRDVMFFFEQFATSRFKAYRLKNIPKKEVAEVKSYVLDMAVETDDFSPDNVVWSEIKFINDQYVNSETVSQLSVYSTGDIWTFPRYAIYFKFNKIEVIIIVVGDFSYVAIELTTAKTSKDRNYANIYTNNFKFFCYVEEATFGLSENNEEINGREIAKTALDWFKKLTNQKF
jgi:hypothetical protein